MSSAVRIGIVGVGDFGRRHAAVAAALPEVQLVAVADRDRGRALTVAQELGCAAVGGIEELLAERAVDAVVIATPQHRHLADVRAAVEAGVPALVEKPVVSAGEEAQRLRELVAGSGVLVVPAHVSRFLPGVAQLRERLAIEPAVAVRAVRVVPVERLDMHGGEHPALVAMVHDLDLVRAVLPPDAELVDVSSVQSWTEPRRPHPQVVMAQLTFSDGSLASVENRWTLPHARQYIDARMEVTTRRWTAHLQTPSGGLRIATGAGDLLPDTDLEATVAGLPVGALATQLRHFAACVSAGRRSEVVDLEDGLWSVEVAARIAAQQPQR
ncbi:Gfo/Idh/MocA family protein [Blastococcus atacamensis]|uniref:Gfo/Idh/MocA family protein n=1 Tax=Blastococcus atacamensis TaxID=2070508 RepID=UPI000CEC550F|nr:Gfo/Idh/MocA family oxidoreductase [Blastococcus atacamensis]